MALHAKNGKVNLRNKFEKLNTAEIKFNNHLIECVEDGLLTVGDDSRKAGVDISTKQYDFVREHRGILYRTAVDVYTDGANTMGRPLAYMTSGVAHSPSREMKTASERNSESQTAIRLLRWQLDKRGYDKYYAYFITMTIPNVDLGQFNVGWKAVRRNTSKIVKAIQDGTNNNNGLRLLASFPKDDGTPDYAKFLGGMASFESTINGDKLIRCDPVGIFHPHAHLLIITDKPIRLKWLKRRLFTYWHSKFSGLFLSPNAFKVKRAFDLSESIPEMSKYMVKPDFYPRFSSKPTAFSKKVFAELFSTIKGTQSKASYWLYGDCIGLVKDMNQSGKGRMVLSSVNAGALPTDTDVYAPDVVTKVTTVAKDSCTSKDISPDEILYANKDLLQYTLWTKPTGIKYPDTKKGRMLKELIEDIDFAHSIRDVLHTWNVSRESRVEALQSIVAVYKGNKRMAQRLAMVEHRLNIAKIQLDDMHKLTDAVSSTVRGIHVRTHDYSTYYKRIALFRQLDFHGVRVTWKEINFKPPLFMQFNNPHATVPVDMPYGLEFPPDADPDLEEKLAQLYLKVDPLDDIKFIDPVIVVQYFMWKHPKWRPMFDGMSVNMYDMQDEVLSHYKPFSPDALDLQLANPLDNSDFQDWVDSTFSKQSK